MTVKKLDDYAAADKLGILKKLRKSGNNSMARKIAKFLLQVDQKEFNHFFCFGHGEGSLEVLVNQLELFFATQKAGGIKAAEKLPASTQREIPYSDRAYLKCAKCGNSNRLEDEYGNHPLICGGHGDSRCDSTVFIRGRNGFRKGTNYDSDRGCWTFTPETLEEYWARVDAESAQQGGAGG